MPQVQVAGLFLNTLMFLSFSNMSEMAPTIELRRIVRRQADNGNYPDWIFVIALFVSQVVRKT